ncbi:hypothetical protein GCM10009557_70700 [Virgisporangium ochraceum]|uniref:Uncharacterized protein n=1 Tax=Virgisporangium ochraceum TaxID=65505 RepID=A0A8J4A260_9ACTN|nr:hypothetical protein Voc01_093760 [Virgisporangium ochraceum]
MQLWPPSKHDISANRGGHECKIGGRVDNGRGRERLGRSTDLTKHYQAVRRRRGRESPGPAASTGTSTHGLGSLTMWTVVGFVSLLVAGFGALAGGLVYLAVRMSRGKW